LYEKCKVYGPYKRKDGRKHVCLVWPDGRRQTVSYPKFLTEQKLGRYLKDNETVDHLNCNFNDNDPDNIRVIDRKIHAFEDAKRHKTKEFLCPLCGDNFALSGRKLHDTIWNRKKGNAGPFCSRSCAGKYGKNVQIGKEKIIPIEIIPEYTTIKAELSLNEETH
jgi:hypothetical protein